MGKKLLSIDIKGKDYEWSFNFYEDPKYLKEWWADGLEVSTIINTIPVWVVDLGLMKPWMFFQNIFNFNFFK